MRVLLIDDDEVSREVLELLLSAEGHEVASAPAGAAAVRTVCEGMFSPEVVLTDLQMPGVSGVDLARELRETCAAGVRLILMSGSKPAESSISEYDGFLLKPFSMEAFREAAEAKMCPAAGEAEAPRESARGGAEEDALHQSTYDSFAAMMRKEQMEELYGLCLADAKKQWAALQEAVAVEDDMKFRKAAHTLKGSFGMLGARELQGICARLEASGIIRDAYEASLAEFGPAMERLRRMLRARGLHAADQSI